MPCRARVAAAVKTLSCRAALVRRPRQRRPRVAHRFVVLHGADVPAGARATAVDDDDDDVAVTVSSSTSPTASDWD